MRNHRQKHILTNHQTKHKRIYPTEKLTTFTFNHLVGIRQTNYQTIDVINEHLLYIYIYYEEKIQIGLTD